MAGRLCVLALALLSFQPALAQSGRVAILQGLDKVTARISTIEAPLDERVAFGTLRITVRNCNKRPPEEFPETTAFLVILDEKRDETVSLIFSGWMFASSPALSALEHPVYDIWVKDCVVR